MLSSTFRRKSSFSLLQRPPYFTSEPWNMGCLSPTIRQNQPSPLPALFRARTNQSTADRYRPCPHPLLVVNESIMLHRYEHGLVPRPAIAILFGTRLRRMGACTISLIALLVSYSVSQYDTCCRDSALAELEDTPRFEVSHMHGASQGCTCSFNCKSNKHIPM